MAIKYNESARHWAQSNEIVRTKAIRVGLKIVKRVASGTISANQQVATYVKPEFLR